MEYRLELHSKTAILSGGIAITLLILGTEVCLGFGFHNFSFMYKTSYKRVSVFLAVNRRLEGSDPGSWPSSAGGAPDPGRWGASFTIIISTERASMETAADYQYQLLLLHTPRTMPGIFFINTTTTSLVAMLCIRGHAI